MMLRGQRVLAKCDDAGAPQPGEDGRVEIRYKPGDGREYRAGLRNLGPKSRDWLLAAGIRSRSAA